MSDARRALEERLAALDPRERQRLTRRASQLRDEARRVAKPARGGDRKTSGRHELPAWALRMRGGTVEDWMIRLLEDEATARPASVGHGVVVWTGHKVCRVLVDGEICDAALAATLTRDQQIAVGDEVEVETTAGGPRIGHILPRRTALTRPDPHDAYTLRVIVANIDVVGIVVAARDPPLRPRLIDRALVAIERGGAAPLICVNKVDLLSADERAALTQILAPYLALQVPVLTCSTRTTEGLDEIRARLAGQCAAFVGHSGVGKSSLMNALFPGLDLQVGEVNAFHGKGRHTTTASALHEVGQGTRLIDTPGIRSFGLSDLTPAEIRVSFPEFAPYAARCAWRDCAHLDEIGCAVRAAADAGQIPSLRWESYRRILITLNAG